MVWVQKADATSGLAQSVVTILKTVPAMVAALKVRFAVPVFVSLAVRVLLVPTVTGPKSSGEGLKLTRGTPVDANT